MLGTALKYLICFLFSYLINLCLVMLKKMNGELIEGSPPVDRLIEIRVVNEAVR